VAIEAPEKKTVRKMILKSFVKGRRRKRRGVQSVSESGMVGKKRSRGGTICQGSRRGKAARKVLIKYEHVTQL